MHRDDSISEKGDYEFSLLGNIIAVEMSEILLK